MIYEVYLNDNLLYYPNDDSYSIINAKLETALNEAGSFECDIPQKNMRYTDFDNGQQLRSGIITVLKDGAEIFCGEVREVTQNFDFPVITTVCPASASLCPAPSAFFMLRPMSLSSFRSVILLSL